QLPTARKLHNDLQKIMDEDADCEILIDGDRAPMGDREFQLLVELAKHSGLSITKLYDSVKLKNWTDEARIRKTFYGQNKKTIKEIFDHVKRTQYYYMSRIPVAFSEDEALSIMEISETSLDSLARIFRKQANSKVYNVENEEWTLKKILRRFVWHD